MSLPFLWVHPLAIFLQNPLFWSSKRRREDGTASECYGWPIALGSLGYRFLERQHPGYTFLPFSLTRRRENFYRSEKQTTCAAFSQVYVTFRRVRNSKALQTRLPCTAPAVLRLCSSKGFIRGSVPKAPAQKIPIAQWPTLPAVDLGWRGSNFVDTRKCQICPRTLWLPSSQP